MKKKELLVYLCIAIFGFLGLYFTFVTGDVNKYDRQTKAYRIDPNSSYDNDNNTIYNPTYYFKVNGKNYQCKSKYGSSFTPDDDKNMVYYDSSNPEKCTTEYEKSNGKIAGIICLIVTAIIVYFFFIKKTPDGDANSSQTQKIDIEKQRQIEEKIKKVEKTFEEISIIYKRIILGIIIVVLSILILVDTAIIKQTITSRSYIETTAVYVDTKNESESEIFDDCIYSFKDKSGNQQEVIIGISKGDQPKDEIKLKYNGNNPQDFYEEGTTVNKSGIIWYIVKIVVVILLIIVFFNKRLLSKINIFVK